VRGAVCSTAPHGSAAERGDARQRPVRAGGRQGNSHQITSKPVPHNVIRCITNSVTIGRESQAGARFAAVYPAVAPTPDRRRSTHLGPDRGRQRRIGSHRGLRGIRIPGQCPRRAETLYQLVELALLQSATCSSRISVNVSSAPNSQALPASAPSSANRSHGCPACSRAPASRPELTTSGAACPGSFAQGTSRIYRRPRKPQPNQRNLSSQVTGNSGGIPDECPCRRVTACRASPRTFIFSGHQATCKHTQRVMRHGCSAGPDHSAGPNDLARVRRVSHGRTEPDPARDNSHPAPLRPPAY
jgi:hypothetical protein